MEVAICTARVVGAAMVHSSSLPLIALLLLAAFALAAWRACSPASSSSPGHVMLPSGVVVSVHGATEAEAAEVSTIDLVSSR